MKEEKVRKKKKKERSWKGKRERKRGQMKERERERERGERWERERERERERTNFYVNVFIWCEIAPEKISIKKWWKNIFFFKWNSQFFYLQLLVCVWMFYVSSKYTIYSGKIRPLILMKKYKWFYQTKWLHRVGWGLGEKKRKKEPCHRKGHHI